MIDYEDFSRVDMRAGKIVDVMDFPEALKPSYKIKIDFGPEIGTKWSSAQAKKEYTKEQLLDREVIGVVNLKPKKIAGFTSEVLLLGVQAENGSLSLLEPSRKPAKIGSRVY